MTVTLAPRPRPIAAARWLAAEVFGTSWLVVGGCGAAVLAAATGVPGSFGLVSVSLTVLTMAFAVGFISGGYSNPAVGVGLVRQLWLFRAAPLLGASVAGLLGRWLFARGRSISRPVRSATCRSSGSSTPTARPRRAEPLER